MYSCSNQTSLCRYRLLTHPKPVGWEGVRWSAVDDAKLLIGVYEHGLGNWENIRDDPTLGFSKKVCVCVCVTNTLVIHTPVYHNIS